MIDDVTDLSGRRTRGPILPPGEPEEQVYAILDRPDASQFIATIDPPTIHRLVHDAGWEAAADLVPHLTAEQLQTCVDLDCWSRHEFRPGHLAPWLAALVSGADDATFRRRCRELDAEVLALWVKEYLLVDVWGEEGEVPDAFIHEEYVERSPDQVYALVYRGDEATNALLRAMLDRLFELDMVMAWTLLEAARWELKTGMEEEALRWRSSRLEEWGFVDFDEAMQIYRPLNGAPFRDRIEAGEVAAKPLVDPDANLPVLLDAADDDRFYAARIMKELGASALESVMAEFVALQNRASVAEGIDPGDRSDTQSVADRTTGYLSIGLEFLARRDDEQAVEILRHIALRDIFRVGFTTVDRLRENVQRVRRRPTLSLVEGQRFSLLRAADAALCESIANIRPTYAAADGTRDIFHTQAQVDDAAQRLGLIAFKQLWLFGVMNASPAELVQRASGDRWINEAPDLTFDAFFTTAVAQVILGQPPDTMGLAPAAVRQLPPYLSARAWETDVVAAFEPVVGPVFEALGVAGRLMTTWLEMTLAELVDELGPVIDASPQLFTSLLVLRRESVDP